LVNLIALSSRYVPLDLNEIVPPSGTRAMNAMMALLASLRPVESIALGKLPADVRGFGFGLGAG
jgi:hypothetical protein